MVFILMPLPKLQCGPADQARERDLVHEFCRCPCSWLCALWNLPSTVNRTDDHKLSADYPQSTRRLTFAANDIPVAPPTCVHAGAWAGVAPDHPVDQNMAICPTPTGAGGLHPTARPSKPIRDLGLGNGQSASV